MSDKTNLVFLVHRKPLLQTDVVEVIACANCRNKTYTAKYTEGIESFPQLECAACGVVCGKFGWIGDEK